MSRPTLLILSFSRLVSDARLLKQIRAFEEEYDVTTCGFGPAPTARVRHIELKRCTSQWPKYLEAVGLRTKWYRLAYWSTPHVKEARRVLQDRYFDAMIANDLDTVGVALAVCDPQRIHLDLHEFWPGIHDDVPSWKRLRAPFYTWQLRTWARNITSITTINGPLAQRYADEFGLTCEIVTNATEYANLLPSETDEPLRLVHSGGAQPNRNIERMMRAVARTEGAATLDLFLIGEGTEYYRSLQALAEELGDRVRIQPPVGHEHLVARLNRYDVGLPFLPPSTTNIRMTLPNKFFDYVQARLAILTGPTPPIAELVREYDLGVITADFEEESLVQAVASLTREQVARWKRQANVAARPLSAERGIGAWTSAVRSLTSGGGVKHAE